MDGHGRWAKQRGLPVRAGHEAGVRAVLALAAHCPALGIKALTVSLERVSGGLSCVVRAV